jgi:hypothetical protein
MTWEALDEQPVEHLLVAHERFNVDRTVGIEGFVLRAELEPIPDPKKTEAARLRRISRDKGRAR